MKIENNKYYTNNKNELIKAKYDDYSDDYSDDPSDDSYPFNCYLLTGELAFTCTKQGKWSKHIPTNSDLTQEVTKKTHPELCL